MNILNRKYIIGFSLVFAFQASMADTYVANQDLKRAYNELEVAKVYINKAKSDDTKSHRVVFHYNWLVSDINKVEDGINQKFNTPRIQPRTIAPLKGDYMTLVGEKKTND